MLVCSAMWLKKDSLRWQYPFPSVLEGKKRWSPFVHSPWQMCFSTFSCQLSTLLRSLLHWRIHFQAQKGFVCLYTCALKEVFLLLMPVGWLAEFFSIYKNAKCLKWESNDNIIRIPSWGQMRQMVAWRGYA